MVFFGCCSSAIQKVTKMEGLLGYLNPSLVFPGDFDDKLSAFTATKECLDYSDFRRRYSFPIYPEL